MIRKILFVAVGIVIGLIGANLFRPSEEQRASHPGVARQEIRPVATDTLTASNLSPSPPTGGEGQGEGAFIRIAGLNKTLNKTKMAQTSKIHIPVDPTDRPDIVRMRRDIQVESTVGSVDLVPYPEPEPDPAVETPPVSAAVLSFDPSLADEAPDKLSRMVGNAFQVIHTPDTFQIPPSWKGAEVAIAALQDALWSENAGRERGWAVKDGLGKKYLVPKTVLARIVRRLEEKHGGSQAPLYRVDVFLNTEDIVDVRLEYF